MLIGHENKIKAQSEDILFINKIWYDNGLFGLAKRSVDLRNAHYDCSSFSINRQCSKKSAPTS